MAERQFVMIIRNEAGGGKAGNKIGGAGGIGDKQGGNPAQSTDKPTNGEKAANILAKKMLGMFTVQSAMSTVNKIVAHNNGLIEVRTGSREQQERTSYIYNNISSFVGSTVGGAVSGATVAGVPGAIVGGVLGAVTSAANFGINYLQQSAIIAENKQLETLTRLQTTQRVTVSGSRYLNATQI